VDLEPGYVYIMSSEKGTSKSAASSAWYVPVVIFGGKIMKLSDQTLSDIDFKQCCEILIVLIDEQGIDPAKIEWGAVEVTVARPLEYGTPRKVQFQYLPLNASLLDLEGWTGVSPVGSNTEEEDTHQSASREYATNEDGVGGHGQKFKHGHT
jgi:hypothetical protein